MIKRRQTCRICGSNLIDILDLGEMHLPGYIGKDNTPEVTRKVQLTLSRCDTLNEKSCGLVQLRNTTPSYLLYKKYFYLSGINKSMVEHLYSIVDGSIDYFAGDLSKEDIIIDIGCNDGTLLEYWKSLGYTNILGFDPAKNLFPISSGKGICIICDYFNQKTFWENSQKKAKLITSIAMFYDLEDPKSFVNDIVNILDTDGIWITEQSYLPSFLKQNAFDTICHEHLEYYSLSVIENLIASFGLEIVDVTLNNTNGGSFQIYIAHKGRKEISDQAYQRIEKIRIDEFNMSLDTELPYLQFIDRVLENGIKLKGFLLSEKAKGKKIFAYGASTKGAITLQHYGIDSSLIDACSDRNEKKWGTSMAGLSIPIISEDDARKQKPDYFLVLPWHFIDDFTEREKEFLGNGGHFIVPMPYFRVI